MPSPSTTITPREELPTDTAAAVSSSARMAPSMACTSILDNDLYKFTMQQAVRQHHPTAPCDYYFTNRSPLRARLPQAALPWLRQKIDGMAGLRLTSEERLFLERRCPYLTKDYLDWLQFEFQFKPAEQVIVQWKQGGGSLMIQSEPGSPHLGPIGNNEGILQGKQQEKKVGLKQDEDKHTAVLNMGFVDSRVAELQRQEQQSRHQQHGSQPSLATKDEEVVEIIIQGIWHQVILYEVPILALVSEAFFRFGDTDWSYEGQFESARAKSERLVHAGATFAEFGTRRRRDYETQRIVMEGLIAGSASVSSNKEAGAMTAASPAEAIAAKKGFLAGTSNLHFAQVFNLTPIGTMAHEWFMGTAAVLGDASQANQVALDRWAQTYPNQVLGIALTDTFTTEVFLKTFRGELARTWNGVRHDSGDPFEFMDRIIYHYDHDPLVGCELRQQKKIVFSDGLDTDLAIKLHQAAVEKGIGATFGIGTHFTNDYYHRSRAEGGSNSNNDGTPTTSPAMNIVIKLHSCAHRECVKLSDDPGKESGSPEAIALVKQQVATLV
ncbi:nicotinate phosphoribosyltransferase [Linnemannia zychae]|nr:nicotinate phosphoribosyltransferase [Linnemannia zychae]